MKVSIFFETYEIFMRSIKKLNCKMLKTNFLNISLYIFIKSIIFYCILMILNNDFTLLNVMNNIKNGKNLFYYLWVILFFPIVDILFFSIPLYHILKVKKIILSIILVSIVIVIEYLLYVYFTTQKIYDRDATIKIVVSIILLIIFFYKAIFRRNS